MQWTISLSCWRMLRELECIWSSLSLYIIQAATPIRQVNLPFLCVCCIYRRLSKFQLHEQHWFCCCANPIWVLSMCSRFMRSYNWPNHQVLHSNSCMSMSVSIKNYLMKKMGISSVALWDNLNLKEKVSVQLDWLLMSYPSRMPVSRQQLYFCVFYLPFL